MAMQHLRVPMLTAATVGATDGTSQPVDVSCYSNVALFLKTNGSPGAGTLVIEEADWTPGGVPSTLSWSTIATLTITSAVGNSAQTKYSCATGAYHFIRARIGTSVTVATLDVVLVAV